MLGSFHVGLVLEAKRKWPSMRCSVMSSRPQELAGELGDTGVCLVDCVSLDYRRIDRDTVEWFRARGVGVWNWTVNDPDEAVRLGRLGVEVIITDDPPPVMRALEAAGLRGNTADRFAYGAGARPFHIPPPKVLTYIRP